MRFTHRLNVLIVPKKQRLALFLDGTWNTEDDGTNILNAYHLTQEGWIEEQNVIQRRYYDRGVGTNMTGRILGGSLGLGLEKNVREAYHWLVDNYNDDDEIYIFGFSRGAYTARSLVGLIAACGLVHRGAPVTINQLWKGYAFISNHRDKKEDEWWNEALNETKNKDFFRRLPKLKDCEDSFSHSEELVRTWSRRVPITYLGIYDTVGALGIHSLGIPGLRSNLNDNHNLNPSEIIKKCRHALAIDESRASFRLTPILDHVYNNPSTEKGKPNGYQGVIEQRWFVGAHANIGGGYTSNVLGERPFKWMMEGALPGLVISKEAVREVALSRKSVIKKPGRWKIVVNDSFAAMGYGVFPHVIREKRNFRPIGRDDFVRVASTLRSIDEQVDPSVFDYAASNGNYAPINLISYLRRHPEAHLDNDVVERQPINKWPGEIVVPNDKAGRWRKWVFPILFVVLWSLFGAVGFVKMTNYFFTVAVGGELAIITLIAGLLVLVDWAETQLNIAVSLNPRAVVRRVGWNVVYWMRWLGLLAMIVGASSLVVRLSKHLWQNGVAVPDLWKSLLAFLTKAETYEYIWPFLITAVAAISLSIWGNNTTRLSAPKKEKKIDPRKILLRQEKGVSLKEPEQKNSIIWWVIGPLVAVLLVVIWINLPGVVENTSSPQKLLLAFLLWFAFIALTIWVGKTTVRAKLPANVTLRMQSISNRDKIPSLFNEWLSLLTRSWMTPADQARLDAACTADIPRTEEQNHRLLAWLRLKEVLRTSLWRDLLGFTPLYSLIFGTILYIGYSTSFTNLNDAVATVVDDTRPFWPLLILATALFDVVENTIHLRYLRSFEKGGESKILPILGICATVLKFIGFFVAASGALLTTLVLLKDVLMRPDGWEGVLIVIAVFFFLLLLLGSLARLLKSTLTKGKEG